MTVYHVCEIVLDVLFPPTEEALLVRRMEASDVENLYSPRLVDGVTALANFREHRVRALIHEAKFHRNTRAQRLLGTLVRAYVDSRTVKDALVVPIPLSPQRLRSRGYNQVLEVLSYAASGHVDSTILIRTRDTRPQTELSRHERQSNLMNAFAVQHPARIAGKHILLVDDVLTTGATMSAAKAALLRHSPTSVTCIAIAH